MVATVLYDSSSVVDIAKIQNRLFTNNSARSTAITTSEDTEVRFRLRTHLTHKDFLFNLIETFTTDGIQGRKPGAVLAFNFTGVADSTDSFNATFMLYMFMVSFVRSVKVSSSQLPFLKT